MSIEVSVVIPTHNRLHLLRGAVGLALAQKGVSVEVVVVNDGSRDGTDHWLGRLAAGESRVKVISHDKPRFMSSARNAGIAQASGKWVAFCDDDDLWAPDKLAAQLRALAAEKASWSCTGGVLVDEALHILGHHHVKGGDLGTPLIVRNVIPSGGSSVIADKRLLQAVGGFDAELLGSEDWDLWIRLARHSPIAAVDRPMIAYRQGRATMSTNVERMRKGREAIVHRYGASSTPGDIKNGEAAHERYLAKQLLRAGAGRKAAAIFASLVVKHRQWCELPRVFAALLAPRTTDRIGSARAAAAVPAEWRREAEAWLKPLRRATNSSVPSHGFIAGLALIRSLGKWDFASEIMTASLIASAA